MNTHLALENFGRILDRRRLKRRFERVERQLRLRDVSSWPDDLQRKRARYLDLLHGYWTNGRFPRNYAYPRRYTPCFIDPHGTACAVAHLVIQSGQRELALRIAREANYATIGEMTFPELDVWAAEIGLTRDELALIQPGYPGLDYLQQISVVMLFSCLMASLGAVAFVWNLFRNLKNSHPSRDGFQAGLIFGIVTVATAIIGFLIIGYYVPILGPDYSRQGLVFDIGHFFIVLICGLVLIAGSLGFMLLIRNES